MELTTLISLISAPLAAFLLVWYLGRQKQAVASFTLLDLLLLSWVSFFVVSRLLGIIFFATTFNFDWSVLPLTQPEENILFLQTWPWQFFRFGDGKFLFSEIVSGFVLAEILFGSLNTNRLSFKQLVKIRNQSFLGLVIITAPLLVAARINGYLARDFEPALVLVVLFINIISALVVVNIIDDIRYSGLMIFANHLLAVVLLNLTYVGNNSLLVINFVLAVILGIHFFKLLTDWRQLHKNQGQTISRPRRVNYSKLRRDYKPVSY